MKAAAFDYLKPRTPAEALKGLKDHEGDAKPMSGGCSFGPMLNLRLARPTVVIDLRGLSELRSLNQLKDCLSIGACWTHAEIEDGLLPDVTRGMLPYVARGIAYRAVRNRGTIGGSLAHADPAADWINTMQALDARIVVTGTSGVRRLDLSSFMIAAYTTALAEDEIISAIEVPVLTEGSKWSYYKICRKTGEFAHAIGVVVLDPARGLSRVVTGAVEAPPIVLEQTSAALFAEGPHAAMQAFGNELDERLAGHDPVFQQLHKVAVERALRSILS